MELAAHFLETVRQELRRLKTLGEKALGQVNDTHLQDKLDPESNSLAILVRHLSGNMLSRWTDFLTTDGEKPDRDRNAEFEDAAEGRQELLERWERGWQCALDALDRLGPQDLSRAVTIRGESFSVLEAIHRQLGHYAYHVGQMVFLAKHLAAGRWQSLSIPRGNAGKNWPYKGG